MRNEKRAEKTYFYDYLTKIKMIAFVFLGWPIAAWLH